MADKTILIVDNQDAVEGLITKVATPGSVDVSRVDNGDDALAFAKSSSPDLIVLSADINKGFFYCRKFKRDTTLKAIPLILVTYGENATAFDDHRKLPTKADEYCVDPVSSPDFFKQVSAFVELQETTVAEEIEGSTPIDDIIIPEDDGVKTDEVPVFDEELWKRFSKLDELFTDKGINILEFFSHEDIVDRFFRFEHLEEELEQLKMSVPGLQEKVGKLEADLKEAEANGERATVLEKEIADLTIIREEEQEALNREITNLRVDAKRTREVQIELDEVKRTLEATAQARDELEAAKIALEQAKTEADQQVAELEQELEETRFKAVVKMTEMEKELEDAKSYQSKAEQMGPELEDLRRRYEESQAKAAELKQNIEGLELQMSEVRNASEEQAAEFIKLLEAERSHASEQLTASQEQANEAVRVREELEAKVLTLEEELEEARGAGAAKDETISTHEATIAATQAQLEEASAALQAARAETDTAREELEAYKATAGAKETELAEQLTAADAAHEAKLAELTEAQEATIAELTAAHELALTEAQAAAEAKVAELQESIAVMERAHDEALDQASTEQAAKVAELEGAMAAQQEAHAEALSQEKAAAEALLAEMEAAHAEEKASLEAQASAAEEALRTSSEEALAEKDRAHAEALATIETDREAERQALQAAVDEATGKVAALEQQLAEVEQSGGERIEALEADLLTKEEALEALGAEKEAIESSLARHREAVTAFEEGSGARAAHLDDLFGDLTTRGETLAAEAEGLVASLRAHFERLGGVREDLRAIVSSYPMVADEQGADEGEPA